MITSEMTTKNVQVQTCSSLDDAMKFATGEAANTSGTIIPGILFKQGARYNFCGAMPVPMIMDKLEVKSAKKGDTVTEVKSATNRPMMPDHVKSIGSYIKENVLEKYIIPPLTLNVQQKMLVFASSTSASMSVAYAVIPATARMSITDGLHRKNGIEFGYDLMSDIEREEFSTHSVSVMITFEDTLGQIHQDFADCSKTKALPPSLVAAFDRRNPANGIVLDLVERVELFNDKVDSTSKTLGKNSNMLFLVNHIRQYVKELLVGDWAMANVPFETKASKQLGKHNSPDYSLQLEKFVKYTEEVVSVVSPLDTLIDLPRGPQRMLIAQKRNEGWVSMSAMGLILLGRIGHVIIRDDIPFSTELKNRLKAIDWSREADFWKGNQVMDGRILTSRIPTKKAMKKLLEYLDIGESDLMEFSSIGDRAVAS